MYCNGGLTVGRGSPWTSRVRPGEGLGFLVNLKACQVYGSGRGGWGRGGVGGPDGWAGPVAHNGCMRYIQLMDPHTPNTCRPSKPPQDSKPTVFPQPTELKIMLPSMVV